MTSQLVATTIRRSNRNRILLGSFILIGLIVIAALNVRYLTNFVSGPRIAERGELLVLENPETVARNWVDVTGDENYDTGMQMVRTSSRSGTETVESNYMALLIDDRLLLVKTASDAKVKNYTGALVPIPADVQTEVVDYVETSEDVKGAFLPYMLDTDNFRFGGYLALGGGMSVALGALYLLLSGIQRGDTAKHPLMKRLARHGDPASVISEVENELLTPLWTHRNLRITRNWLVQTNSADFNAMRLSDIAWLYKMVTQRRVNGIPAGKTFAAHIFDTHNQKLELASKNEQDVHTILESIHNAAPWAFVGYSADLEKTWKQNRASVIEAVVQRRQDGVTAAEA